MSRAPARLLATLAAAVLLTACGSGAADDTATDPTDPTAPADPGPMPTTPPAAIGEVVTRVPATVMDTGSPELCLGAIAESYPPQCGGPALVGWDWADHEGSYERAGDVRWGEFVVTGTWDGTTMTPSRARPAEAGDRPVDTAPIPPPADQPSPDELAAVAEEVGGLGGGSGAYATQEHVFVDVPYDDGSLQAWADATYGAGVVVVTPALADA